MSKRQSTQGGPGDAVVLGGRYRIFPDKPLPSFDSPTAMAVEAGDARASSRNMIALVCNQGIMPRIDIVTQLSRLTRMPMHNPVDAGAVFWPKTGTRRQVVVFDHNAGEPVVGGADARFTPLREDQIVDKVINPLIPALKELSRRGLRHRAIRADNIYYFDASQSTVILGECISGPPGVGQPLIYEPIDLAMANRSCLGPGTTLDDLYAFGAMIAVLLHGGNPIADKSDDEVIEMKITHGSYTTLVGDLRVSLAMMEPVRGLLCDIPAERWTAAELELWAGGRRLSPKQPMLPVKAARAASFAGKEYLTRPALSFAMGRNWNEAGAFVASGGLAEWLKRSFGDEESAKSIQSSAAAAGDTSRAKDRLVTRALAILDPIHPLRYRSICARVEGLPSALAMEFGNEKFRGELSELLRTKLPQVFLKMVGAKGGDQSLLVKTLEMIAYFIAQPRLGNGVERALYEANRGWPCQSPPIRDDYVCDLEDLLPALEAVCQNRPDGVELLDPHIVAFCAARNKVMSEDVLVELNRQDESSRYLGTVRLLAEAHAATGASARYPALAQMLASQAAPVIESYHNRAYRDHLAAEVRRVGDGGNLTALLGVLDNAEARHEDTAGFIQAQNQYNDHVRTIAWLEAGGLASKAHIRARSRQVSTFLSAMTAGVTMVVLALIYVT